jgi:hypothetical protein
MLHGSIVFDVFGSSSFESIYNVFRFGKIHTFKSGLDINASLWGRDSRAESKLLGL